MLYDRAMAKRITVRVGFSEIEMVGLDALRDDIGDVSRSEAIRYAVSRALMTSTVGQIEEEKRRERIRRMELFDHEQAKFLSILI